MTLRRTAHPDEVRVQPAAATGPSDHEEFVRRSTARLLTRYATVLRRLEEL